MNTTPTAPCSCQAARAEWHAANAKFIRYIEAYGVDDDDLEGDCESAYMHYATALAACPCSSENRQN